MSEPHVKRMFGGQIIRSGSHGHYVITRETVMELQEQLRERPVPVNIEHDPTQLPVGRVIGGRLVELDDGEVALETEMEMFTGTVPASLYPASQMTTTASELPTSPAVQGPLELIIDDRSYHLEELEEVRRAAAHVGEIRAREGALRFSELPDALLVLALGSTATATWWFSKGFFSKLGERVGDELGGEVGQDIVAAYRLLKAKLRELVRHRQPADRPPLTMLTLQIEREDGGTLEVEGSSRAEDEGLDDLLDGGRDLLTVARVYAQLVPEPARLTKLHFARENGGWHLRYGLDVEARPVIVVALSEARYAEMLAEAERAG